MKRATISETSISSWASADRRKGQNLFGGSITTNSALAFARKGITGHPALKGWIDDARIYNRVLKECEILALYNEGDGLPQDGVE